MSMAQHEKALDFLADNFTNANFCEENHVLYKLTPVQPLLESLPPDKRKEKEETLEPHSHVLQHWDKKRNQWLTHWKLVHTPRDCE